MVLEEKNKPHDQEKEEKAQESVQASGGAEKTAEAPEEPSASSQNLNGDAAQSPPNAPKKEAQSTMTASSDSDSCFPQESDENESFETKYLATNLHRDMMVKKLLKFLLQNYNKKQISTKEDMLKVVSEQYENDFPEIFRKTSEKLEEIFAVEVREVDSSPPSYTLISKLKLPNNGRVHAGKGLPKTGFLLSILGIIFTRGNCAKEEDVWKVLKGNQIYPGKKHRIFGEPRKLITKDFVRLKYLEYRQVANSDPPQYEFLWGPKAHAETSKMKVLQFLAKINNTTPSAMKNLYQEALKDEQERA